MRASLAEISGDERRVLMLACFIGVVAYVPVAVVTYRVATGPWSVSIGLADSFGSAATVKWADKLAAESIDKRSGQFLAGVAHHLAGDVDAARRFYSAIPDDPRARSNLAALAHGQLTPPSPATLADVTAANAGRMTLSQALSREELWEEFHDPSMLVVLMTVLGGVSFALSQRRNPFHGARSPLQPPATWHKVVPGALDLLGGRPVRGQIALSLASVSVVSLSIAAYAAWSSAGSVFADSPLSSILRAFPVPPYSFWTVFWARPGAVTYWSCVGVATLVVIVLQILAHRRCRNRSSDVDPSLSSQDTRVRG